MLIIKSPGKMHMKSCGNPAIVSIAFSIDILTILGTEKRFWGGKSRLGEGKVV